MNRILFLALCCFATAANAQSIELPPCWPKQLGSTGSDFVTGETEDGSWLGWTCTVKGVKKSYGVWAVTDYRVVHPNTAGLTPIKTAQTYWRANVVGGLDYRLVRLRQAMNRGVR